LGAAVLILASLWAAHVATAGHVAGLFHDEGVYIVTAESLANADGYRAASLPGAPAERHYPPLLPLVLAAVWRRPAPPSGHPAGAEGRAAGGGGGHRPATAGLPASARVHAARRARDRRAHGHGAAHGALCDRGGVRDALRLPRARRAAGDRARDRAQTAGGRGGPRRRIRRTRPAHPRDRGRRRRGGPAGRVAGRGADARRLALSRRGG